MSSAASRSARVDPVPGGGGGAGAKARAGGAALALGALGDIGTSPLYALHAVFTADHGAVHATPGEVYGVVSLVFWSITVIVSVEYVGFVMRADNAGEGGILALTALLQGAGFRSARAKLTIITLGILGASLFIGDGMITPAVSVHHPEGISVTPRIEVTTQNSADSSASNATASANAPTATTERRTRPTRTRRGSHVRIVVIVPVCHEAPTAEAPITSPIKIEMKAVFRRTSGSSPRRIGGSLRNGAGSSN